MVAANNGYDWLGTGRYFWEEDPMRAMHWAVEAKERHEREGRVSNAVRDPYVVGAVINLGRCLDLTTLAGVAIVRNGFNAFKKAMRADSIKLPRNVGGKEMKGRYLDFAVVNYSCSKYLEKQDVNFHTVRALFLEGKPVYPNAGFREKTHVQLCVRRPDAILGFFRLKDQPEVEGL